MERDFGDGKDEVAAAAEATGGTAWSPEGAAERRPHGGAGSQTSEGLRRRFAPRVAPTGIALAAIFFLLSLSLTLMLGNTRAPSLDQQLAAEDGESVAGTTGEAWGEAGDVASDVPEHDGSAGVSEGHAPVGGDPEGEASPAGESAPHGVASGAGGEASEPAGASDHALLAIVIDDWGYAWEAAGDFLGFAAPLNVAVIPYQPLSERHARAAYEAGHQVILHLPMEPLEPNWDLGEGAITTLLQDDEISRDVAAALGAVPFITGVNNHMGSKATADPRVMRPLLEEVKAFGLFFLDSRTTSASVVPQIAEGLRVPYLVNDRFIDPDGDAARVRDRILAAARTARRRGYAVAIGHVRRETYQGLVEALPLLEAEGVRLAYLWEILDLVRPTRGF